MIRFTLVTSLFALVFPVFSQKAFKSFVTQNHTPVASIDNDDNYAGYEAIGRAIGDRRVVMLGEQDHGDATTFIAKTKIIRYLHEQKGFNVIAFESDFFALTEGRQMIGNDTARLRLYLQDNIFPIWTMCQGCSGLFYDYLPAALQSPHPIVVTGFDSQLHGRYSRNHLRGFLDTAFAAMQWPAAVPREKLLDHAEALMKSYGRKLTDPAAYDSARLWLQTVSAAREQQKGKDYTTQLLRSILAFNNQAAMYDGEYNALNDVRDEGMAANLDWLVNVKYKDEKIIVWAASEHIMKNSGVLMKHHFATMGTRFCNMPGNEAQSYILGFTSGTGTTGRLAGGFKPYGLRKPDKDSFENWFGNTPFTFTDFIPYNKSTSYPEAFKMKGINHSWNGKLAWSKSYDGIFYLKEMAPCVAIGDY